MALYPKTSTPVLTISHLRDREEPALTCLDQPFCATEQRHTTSRLRDLLRQHGITGRKLLSCVDAFVLERWGINIDLPQHATMMSHIATLRQRSAVYRAYCFMTRSSGGAQPMEKDRARILRRLLRNPLVEGEERDFVVGGRHYTVSKDGLGTYRFSFQA